MEKRKDIDMLRFYGGDIHQKNKEGEYVITNNLVNPKNKEDVLWGDRDAYRTLNALLFDGIENEKERIYKEKRKLNPVFIELIENTLEIYRGIFAVMCRKKGNQLSVSKVKRVDRKASLMAYLKGHTESFVSCTNGEYDDEFASKNNIILLEIESLENEELRRGYYLGIINQRGVHWIDPEGKPELELAEDYENKANIAESRGYSRYAGILRGVADEFKREAKSNILEAKNGDDE